MSTAWATHRGRRLGDRRALGPAVLTRRCADAALGCRGAGLPRRRADAAPCCLSLSCLSLGCFGLLCRYCRVESHEPVGFVQLGNGFS
jgi:hypothetical protein